MRNISDAAGGRGRCVVAHTIEPLERRRLLDAVPVGAEFRVNTTTPGEQGAEAIAMDAEGNFAVVWFSRNSSQPEGVYAQRYNATGVPQGGEFLVRAGKSYPSIAMDPKGNFVVAWEGGGIEAQRYDASGVAQGEPFPVNSYTGSSTGRPTVAMDSDGNFVVAWQSFEQDGSASGIYGQRFNAAGVPQAGEFRVNTYTFDYQWFPSAAMDADGDFIIAWESLGQDGDRSGIYAQRFDATGAPQGDEFRVNTYTTGHQHNVAVAMDGVGNAVVAFAGRADDSASASGVRARRYDAAGTPQGDPFTVGTPGQYPTVAMRTAGGFVVTRHAWQPTGRGWGQQFGAQGERVGGAFPISRQTDNQVSSSVAMDPDGGFVVVWTNWYQDGSETAVYAQRFAEAAVASSDFLFSAAPHRLSFAFNGDVSAGLGTEDLVIQNLTTGQTIPSSAFALAYDTATNTATFAYTGTTSGVTGMLPDGRYRATILASGTSLNDDYSTEFLFLQGDADHDGRINLQDFNILAANFGQSPRDFTQGDFNYDGVVNLDDFNVLAGRFGVVLAPAASVVNTFPSGTRAGDDEHDAEDWLT